MLPTPPGLDAALADRYTLRSVLGAGGTSTVYRARDEKHGRDVAIKVLRPELAASLTKQRFARETSIVAKLQHPHILSLIDSGAAAETYYFVMPLVEGVTLSERLGEGQAFEIGEATRILADLADALAYAHEKGVVHRDIKPSNVLLAGRHALLMDFGVAKNTPDPDEEQLTVGIALGTPAYMSPEQAMALPSIDHRADLYALGILGYELLTGRPPFSGGSPQDILAAQVAQPPEDVGALRPDVPERLGVVIMRCLEKDPGARWPDANAVVRELDALITPSGGTTPTPGLPARGSPPIWRRPWVGIAAATLTLVGALIFGLADGGPRPITTDREQITFEGNVVESAISADGQWLAYVASNGPDQALFVRDLRSPTALELDRGASIAGLVWSVDGSEIAYGFGAPDPVLRAMPRLGGAGRVLGRGYGLPSPDLSRVAFFQEQWSDVRIVSQSSGDTVRFARPEWVTFTNRLSWSPDSRHVAIEVNNTEEGVHAILVTWEGGSFVEVARDSARITEPSFSRDGRFLYYLRQATGELPDLMRIGIAADGRPRGDPQLVFTAFDGGARSEFYFRRNLNRVTHTVGGDLVYVRTDGESNVWAFEVSPIRGAAAEPQQITTGSAVHLNVRVSPDGERLALVRITRLGTMIGVVPAGGGPLQPLIPTVIWGEPSWSPSGDQLATTWSELHGEIQVSVHDFVSGTTSLVNTNSYGADMTWAGTYLLAQGPGNRRLVLIDPESGEDQTLVSDTVGFNFRPRSTPDGRQVAYFKNWRNRGLWVQGVGTGDTARQLLEAAVLPLRFDATGEFVFASDDGRVEDRPRRILKISLSSGEVQTIMTLPAGYVAEDITPDGRRVFATRISWRGDVWRLTPSGE